MRLMTPEMSFGAPPAPPPPSVPLTHSIAGWSLAWITVKNLFLTVITLGLWSFWGKTLVRRYLWANIQIDGDPLHYTGTGFELFKGAIIALLFLTGFFVILYIISLVGFPMIAGGLQILGIISLTPVALFYARRYRLSRTEWRGIRAGFGGDLKPFVGKTIVLTLLSAVTLGLADPVRQVYIERYFWTHSTFGTATFDCDLTVGKIGKSYWIAWAIMALSLMPIVYLLFIKSGGDPTVLVSPQGPNEAAIRGLYFQTLWVLPAFGIILLVWMLYRAQFLRMSLNSLSLNGLRVQSAFTPWTAFKVGAGALFMVLLPGGLLMAALIMLTHGIARLGGIAVLLPLLLTPLIVITVGTALWARFWTARFAITLVTTTHLSGTFAAETVAQSPLQQPDRGEGLLNAVDFGI